MIFVRPTNSLQNIIMDYCIKHEVLYIYTIILIKSVDVRKLQVAILARSSREMSLTVRIV